MSKEDPKRYLQKYPHYMPWSRRLYVLSPGQKVKKDCRVLTIKQVTRSPIQGEPPRIILEED